MKLIESLDPDTGGILNQQVDLFLYYSIKPELKQKLRLEDSSHFLPDNQTQNLLFMNQINYNAYMYLLSSEYLSIVYRDLIIWG